jgi:hypothetical protein
MRQGFPVQAPAVSRIGRFIKVAALSGVPRATRERRHRSRRPRIDTTGHDPLEDLTQYDRRQKLQNQSRQLILSTA